MISSSLVALVQRGGSTGWAVAAACAASTFLAGLRWLRVSQREHYLPDSASRFALRWWAARAVNRVGLLVALTGLIISARWTVAGFAPAVVVASGPLGLGLRGRTSPLRWTRRLRTLGAVWAVLQGVVVLAGVLSGLAAVFCAAGALATPAVVDLASTVTHPFEEHLGRRYVRRATERLRQVGPKVVAVTGSFGKTSTKGYIAHLLSGSTSVASSPASFNNKLGLARAVNEVLADSTQVFVAEMGTYGRGEIAELCSWMAPDISVITAIGPVHLERFGTEDEILQAKSEILAGAPCCVLMVDDARLDALGAKLRVEGKRVWRVSAGARPDADVNVVARGGAWELSVSASRERTTVPALAASARPANAACAVAVALELGVPFTEISKLLSTLPVAPHRLEQRSASGGFVILDDTYNANPAGVRVALDALQAAAVGAHRRVVVTPGMVELGSRQEEENARFAEAAGAVATDMIVVGRTNRKPLVTGFRRSMREGEGSLVVVDRREQAVDWVRAHLGEGDAVLYGNDLPDHYP